MLLMSRRVVTMKLAVGLLDACRCSARLPTEWTLFRNSVGRLTVTSQLFWNRLSPFGSVVPTALRRPSVQQRRNVCALMWMTI
jgi:hypothetical protein